MSLLAQFALIAAGGALGALARAGLGWGIIAKFGIGALGTLGVNLLGCLLFGAAKAAVDTVDWGSEGSRIFLFTGFLGAFTTFSTFEADLFTLWTDELRLWSIVYVAASVLGGIAAFAVGYVVVSRLST